MGRPVIFGDSPLGVTVQHARGEYENISYNLVAENAEEMAFEILLLEQWLKKKGYVHKTWISKGTRKRAGVGIKSKAKPSEK
jgi:hypothetical protein